MNFIREIMIHNFRNYTYRKFELGSDFNLLVGPNGTGKTNLLEALSLFSGGGGLRGANVTAMTHLGEKETQLPQDVVFALQLKFSTGDKVLLLQKTGRRLWQFNDKPMVKWESSIYAPKITYFVPAMESFFNGNHTNRLRFLDGTANLLFPLQLTNWHRYELLLRERLKILSTQTNARSWLDVVECKITTLAITLAISRRKTLGQLNTIFSHHIMGFPTGEIFLEDVVDQLLQEKNSNEVENSYRETLATNRELDRRLCRTNFGIHRGDLIVFHRDKNLKASLCSSGEQKLLLLALLLARVVLSHKYINSLPLLLLDEVCAHLDLSTRKKLFGELKQLGVQLVATGIDVGSFPITQEVPLKVINL
jgi:DNA replication and repair protein RecF